MKVRNRRRVRYLECEVELATTAPEAPEYYNPAAPTVDRTERAGATGEGAEVCADGDDQTQVSVCFRSQHETSFIHIEYNRGKSYPSML